MRSLVDFEVFSVETCFSSAYVHRFSRIPFVFWEMGDTRSAPSWGTDSTNILDLILDLSEYVKADWISSRAPENRREKDAKTLTTSGIK